MDASSEKHTIAPYIKIANYLHSLFALKAPNIIQFDENQGFMLLEDVGDISLNKALTKLQGDNILHTYYILLDVLAHINTYSKPNIASIDLPEHNFDALVMAMENAITFIEKNAFYFEYKAEIKLATKLFAKYYEQAINSAKVLVLRDYHVDNLMLHTRKKQPEVLNDVCILDFQDASLGNYAYDAVSLIQDVRRFIDYPMQAALVQYYIATLKSNKEEFLYSYYLLGLQRNFRIIGAFTKLTINGHKKYELYMNNAISNFLHSLNAFTAQYL